MKSLNHINSTNQKGIALIVVLFVVSLVALIAVNMNDDIHREIRRSQHQFNHQQAKQYLLGAESFATSILQAKNRNYVRDDLNQPWATQNSYFPIEGGSLQGQLIDTNRCFNLNSLVQNKNKSASNSSLTKITLISDTSSIAYQTYVQLLDLLNLPTELSNSLSDWLDTDDEILNLNSAEDLYYMSLPKAYRSANHLLSDISELYLIKGYTKAIITTLKPYICVLPEANYLKLNVNTIDTDKPELLSMAIKNLPLQTATKLLTQRPAAGYSNLASFWQDQSLSGIQVQTTEKSLISLDSDYFILQAQVEFESADLSLSSLLKQQGQESVQIIWRRYGHTSLATSETRKESNE